MEKEMLELIYRIAGNSITSAILLAIFLFLYKQVPRWVDRHFKMLGEIACGHKDEVKELTQTFRTEIKEERAECAKHNDRVCGALEESNRNTTQALNQITSSIALHHQAMQESILRLDDRLK